MDTFIVRVWVPDAGAPPLAETPQLCGVVEHVRSGTATTFQSTGELLAFLGSERSAAPQPESSPAR